MKNLLYVCIATASIHCCSTFADPTTNWIVGGVGLASGAWLPANNLEQTYYFGVFDPKEQIPESFYRFRVRGQSSFINGTHYASGWVPAYLVDSLNAKINIDKNGAISTSAAQDNKIVFNNFSRRMVLFGPEGFREASSDYRLVIVVGDDPSQFFEAVDQALGAVSDLRSDTDSSGIVRDEILPDLAAVSQHIRSLK